MSRYHLFDSFLDAILVVDREGRVYYGNAAASIVLSVSTKRLSTGRPLSQFISFEPDPFKAEEVFATVEEASQVREVAYRQGKDGAESTGWAQVVFQPQLDFINDPDDTDVGAGPFWIVCIRDVSVEKTLQVKYRGELDQKESIINELRDARQKLESYSKDLEAMVEARTSELTSANQLLKNDFGQSRAGDLGLRPRRSLSVDLLASLSSSPRDGACRQKDRRSPAHARQ